MYISEHYLCFFSNILGHLTKVCLPMRDIRGIEKHTTAFIFKNAICIYSRDEEHMFRSFFSRNKVYGMLLKLLEHNYAIFDEERIDSERLDKLRSSPPWMPHMSAPSPKRRTRHSDRKSAVRDKDKTKADDGTVSSETVVDEKHTLNDSASSTGVATDPTLRAPTDEDSDYSVSESEAGVEPEHMANLTRAKSVLALVGADDDVLNREREEEKKRSEFDRLFGDIEMTRIIDSSFALSVREFFDAFLADGASYAMTDYHKEVNHEEVENTKWVESELGRTRELSYRVPVPDNPWPMAKNSRILEVQRHRFMRNDVVLFDADVVSFDVPYGGTFHMIQKWEIRSHPDDTKQCTLTIDYGVRFTQSTFVKGIITSRSRDNTTEGMTQWTEIIKKRIQDMKLANKPDINDDDDEDEDDDDMCDLPLRRSKSPKRALSSLADLPELESSVAESENKGSEQDVAIASSKSTASSASPFAAVREQLMQFFTQLVTNSYDIKAVGAILMIILMVLYFASDSSSSTSASGTDSSLELQRLTEQVSELRQVVTHLTELIERHLLQSAPASSHTEL
jgi:VAD1 Analog of StAR-related lipid transfer domain/GRAM domain